MVIAGGLLGCGWLIEPSPTPEPSGLPDLTADYESTWDVCSATEFYQAVILTNQGTADAPAFHLVINDSQHPIRVDGLAVGESITFPIDNYLSLTVKIDIDQVVNELDETNNQLNLFGGTSSRPCFTSTPTPTPP
jgi:subtilase family serine protease